MNSIYLDATKGPIENLELMAKGVVGAYTTEAEESTFKALHEDSYGMNKGLCITAIVSVVALAIILGAAVNPLAALVIFAVIIPIGVWASLGSKHSDLEVLHKNEKDKVYDIIGGVADFLNKLRSDKIEVLRNWKTINYDSLRRREIEIDSINGTAEIAKLATTAEKLIVTKHPIKRDKFSSHPVERFIQACSNYSGTSENQYKNVIVIKHEDSSSKYFATAGAHTHYTASVIKGPNTQMRN